jgi:hypothetical protein
MEMLKTTFFMSRHEAQKITAELNHGMHLNLAGKTCLISIISPDDTPDPKMAGIIEAAKQQGCVPRPLAVDSDKWIEVLKLMFDDIDPSHCSDEWMQQWILFDDKMADQIIDMLERTADKTNIYAVHCEAGISRSAAVCKFISVMFNLQFPESYMLYNKHVFTTLIRRWNQRNFCKSLNV